MSISEKQKKVIDFANRPGRMLLACGSVRSGKTFANTIGGLLYSQSQDRALEHLIIGKNCDTLTSAVIEPMQKFSKALGVESWYRPHKSYLMIGRQKYHIRGGENSTSASAIQGLTIHTVIAEELTTLPESFFDMAILRMSENGAKFFGSTNPEGPCHWLKANKIDKGKFDEEQNFDIRSDNPSLSAETIAWYEDQYRGTILFDRFIRDCGLRTKD